MLHETLRQRQGTECFLVGLTGACMPPTPSFAHVGHLMAVFSTRPAAISAPRGREGQLEIVAPAVKCDTEEKLRSNYPPTAMAARMDCL